MSTIGFKPETIVSRLSKPLGSRLGHSEESYVKISTEEVHLGVNRSSYKATWLKNAPVQRIACNSTISSKASLVLNTKVQGVICEVGQVRGQYVSSQFGVP